MKLLSILGLSDLTEAPALAVVANLPVGSKRSTAEIIAEIHHSFNTVGDKLLADAQATLDGSDKIIIDKGQRLLDAGFVNTKQVKLVQEQAQKVAQATAQRALILDYALRYPTNKFITREHVDQIAAKYNLVVGDVSAYTGFVPDKNLREIEAFGKRVSTKDMPHGHVKILKWSHESVDTRDKKRIAEMWPGLLIPDNAEQLNFRYSRNEGSINMNGNNVYFESCQMIPGTSQLIVAPMADMKMDGLSFIKGHWVKATTKHFPDPVVLQPVKGGFLIVTAWGEEASDPLVFNEQLN